MSADEKIIRKSGRRPIVVRNDLANPFGSNTASEKIYKRAERTVTATHLVTNFVPENECLRDFVRENSQELLSDILRLRIGFRSVGSDYVSTVVARIRYILSLIDLMHASGYVSDMNARMLKQAYLALADALRNSEDGFSSESLALTEDYFVQTGAVIDGESMSVKNTEQHKNAYNKPSTESTLESTARKKPTISSVSRTVGNRREAILNVVQRYKQVTVKDIAAIVTDCSEKTIQRELQTLIHDGRLRQQGERRWTTYTIV